MKIFLTLALGLFLVARQARGQEPYAELKVEGNKPNDIQAFEVRDSLFLTYTENDVRKAFWIDRTGKINPVFFNPGKDESFCGIQKDRDTTFLYFLKEKNNAMQLSTLKQPTRGNNIYTGAKTIDVRGNLLGVSADDDGLLVVTYLKTMDRIEIVSISRGKQTGSLVLLVSDDFHKFAASSGFITMNGLTSISQGASPTKIYKQGNSMVITTDEDRFGAAKSATTVIRMDLATGKHVRDTIPGPDYHNFSSFYHDNKLFRFVATTKSYEWVVYDIATGMTLYSKKLIHEKSLRDQKVVIRTDPTAEVLYGSLYRMTEMSGDPSIVVESISGTSNVRIMTGTFLNSKGVVLAGAATPLGILTGLIVANIINQLEPPPGLQQYFYITGNVEKGFDIEPLQNISTPSLQQIIDGYERLRTSGAPKDEEKWNWFLYYKGYMDFDSGALGIYYEKRKNDKKLILLKYHNKHDIETN